MKIQTFFITITFALITPIFAQNNIKVKLPKPIVEKELKNPISLVSIFNVLRNKFPGFFDKEKNYIVWFKRIENITDDKKCIRSISSIQDFIIRCKKFEQKKWDKGSVMRKVIKTTRKILENALKNPEKSPLIDTCKICLATIDPKKEYYFKLPCCQEALFHEKCLMKWYAAHRHGKEDMFTKCPICRKTFSDNVQYLLETEPTYLNEHDEALVKAIRGEDEDGNIHVTMVVNPLMNLLGMAAALENRLQETRDMLLEHRPARAHQE